MLRPSALAAALTAFVAAAIPARADHVWNGWHWARTTPSFDLRVVDSVTAEWQLAFDESLRRWGESSKLDNVVVAVAEDAKSRRRCATVAGHIRVCNADYGQTGWLGIATVHLDANGHITRGVTKVNDGYGWYLAQYPHETNHVMCQEIGHLYGLGHTSEDGSSQGTCMDYANDPASQWPNAHDYEQLELIYDHTDTYDSYATGAAAPCGSPPGRGCNKPDVPRGVPAGAVRIRHEPGRNGRLGRADWVLPARRGGLWVFHLTLLPEDARPPE